MNFQEAIQPFAGQLLTQAILMDLLKEYHWPHNKIRELEKKGFLSPIKRGLYTTGPKLKLPHPSAFLMANHIYGPSYVSTEAALAYWEMIPEKVINITSMTTGTSRHFRTPSGLFSYKKMKLPYYCYGIRQVALSQGQTVLMAGPEKAICDLIITRPGVLLRSTGDVMKFLIEDMRIERTNLQELKMQEIKIWIAHAPKKSSLHMLVKTLEKI